MDVRKNVWLRIGESETLYSCHYDSAHHKGGWQQLEYNQHSCVIWKDDGAALGADDGAGVWLLRELIRAGKPGLYIFHNGEERGCIGSRYIADTNPKMLEGIKRAVAFDRRGRDSVITEMSCGRVCSDMFAMALARELHMKHKPDPTGSMTDTGRYYKLVPECTNVSVGYLNEHGANEMLDAEYLFDLVEAVKAVDFEQLPVYRDPKAPEVYRGHTASYATGYGYAYPNYSNQHKAEMKEALEAAKFANGLRELDNETQTRQEYLQEMFGINELPDPNDEPVDFVAVVMDALSFMTDITNKEAALIENALLAYCVQDPKSVLEDVEDMLGI